jgi:N-acetylneuraminic acid mutarotase
LALIGFGVLLNASTIPQRSPSVPLIVKATQIRGVEGNRTLTFADRVAYQRAIEEVYWQHRIWPKANAGPKPPLEKVMSQAQIEKKVEDYLHNFQALEDYWQRAITPDQLQAEMERIASHTKQPGVLREIFSALGNDPFVIAECLARPVLAERLLTELYAHDQRFHGELKRRAEAELRTHPSVKQMKQTSGMYTEMEWIKSGSADPLEAGVPPAQPTRPPPQKPADTKSVQPVKMNGAEWDESVAKLAAQFDSQEIVGQAHRLPNEGLASGAAALQQPPAQPRKLSGLLPQKLIAQIKTGVLSPLQEDEGHYYAVAVMNKGKDRLKLATIAWLKEPLRSWVSRAETQLPVTMTAVSANYALPAISGQSDNWSPSVACTDDTWAATMGPPDPRGSYTAVWTGSEMIVWGGCNGNECGYMLNTGGRYNPSTDSWTATNITNAPSSRSLHTAVWSGSDMIVWGGYDGSSYGLNSGAKYNPGTDSWTATSTTSAPAARAGHTAVWTGSEMIVWGGFAGSYPNYTYFNTGGRYNPSTDSWTATSTTSAPAARAGHTAVWTGSEMIVWGGLAGTYPNYTYFNTGGRYNPSTNSWTATSTTNAPTGRFAHTAVWTGSQMIVWGGLAYCDMYGCTAFNTGGRYNPATDSWTATNTTNAPSARAGHTAVWTGSEMIVWSGTNDSTGGRYNPTTDSWTATSTTNAPSARAGHTALWTGSEMIVWGGDAGCCGYVNTGGRYDPTTDSWTNTGSNNAPSARFHETAVWTGSEIIVWGGNNATSDFNTGGRYDPATDSWIATSTANAPTGRSVHTAVWTGSEMIVWGGDDGGVYLNTGGRYNPSTDNWAATSTTSAPLARISHTAVWTGSEMVVWGGYECGFNCTFLNTGGRYDPGTDSWTATSTTNAPEARWDHSAVWAGSEMVVWGGKINGVIYVNTGGRYNPTTDSWTATSTTNAPIGRIEHRAVWSGSEMIIWGGDDGTSYFNTGGRYDPGADSWTATSTTNAPAARGVHTAVWTGSQMIIWGGVDATSYLNTGGRYNPSTDSWTATSTTNAPAARGVHTAVWTGSEMIVWGGHNGSDFNTGGRYCAATPSATPTPTPTATATSTPTATVTPTPTPTPTPRPSPTARPSPAPRSRPTPAPRP